MSFAHPLLAWGALAGLLPVVLHLIDRRHSRPQPFAALEFLLRARRATRRQLRLRRLLLLLTRMAALAAIPLALARPHLASATAALSAPATQGPTAVALVLDASGSMRYERDHTTLFAKAQAKARERISSFQSEDAVTVVICGPNRKPTPTPSTDHAAARASVDEAAVSQQWVSLNSCVQEAARALGDSPIGSKRIELFTDMTAADWNLVEGPPEISTPKGLVKPRLLVTDVALDPMPNRSIQNLSIAAAPDVGPHAYRFAFTVQNHTATAATDVSVVLRAGDQLAARGLCDIPAQGSIRKTLVGNFSPGQRVAGAIQLTADALVDDDAAAFVLQVPREIHALLVDGAPSTSRYRDEAYFTQVALEAGASDVQTRTVDADSVIAKDLADEDVAFLLNVRSVPAELSGALAQFVERGGGLFLSMGDRVDPELTNSLLGKLLPMPLRLIKTAATPPIESDRAADTGTAVEESEPTGSLAGHISIVDSSSPIFSPFGGTGQTGLADVRVYRYFLLDPAGAGSRVLASYDDGAPALVEARRGTGRVILFTSSVAREWTDWPIRTSFVPTLQQIARELSGITTETAEIRTVVGQPHPLPNLPGETPMLVIAPSGRELPVETQAGGFAVASPPEVGLYRVKVRAGNGKVVEEAAMSFSVSYDPRESDTTRLDHRELEARYGKVESPLHEQSSAPKTPLWTTLLAVGCLAFLLEGFLLKR